METVAISILSAFVISIGIARVRVGLIGQHLGGAKLVSYVKKYPEVPQLHHRRITVGVGAVIILIGVGFLFLLVNVISRTKWLRGAESPSRVKHRILLFFPLDICGARTPRHLCT